MLSKKERINLLLVLITFMMIFSTLIPAIEVLAVDKITMDSMDENKTNTYELEHSTALITEDESMSSSDFEKSNSFKESSIFETENSDNIEPEEEVDSILSGQNEISELSSRESSSTGKWGEQVNYKYDANSKTLTLTPNVPNATLGNMPNNIFKDKTAIETLVFEGKMFAPATGSQTLFTYRSGGTHMEGLKEIKGMENFDLSKVTNALWLFRSWGRENPGIVTGFDFSTLNFKQLTNVESLFDGTNLSGISSYQIDQITTNISMPNVTKASNMFNRAKFPLNTELSFNYDFPNVTETYSMFNGLVNVTKLDLSRLVLSKNTNAQFMFRNSNFKYLDISSMTFTDSINVRGLFQDSSKLETIVFPSTFKGYSWFTPPGGNTPMKYQNNLPSIPIDNQYTGLWYQVNNPKNKKTSFDLTLNFKPEDAGEWRKEVSSEQLKFSVNRTGDTADLLPITVNDSLNSTTRRLQFTTHSDIKVNTSEIEELLGSDWVFSQDKNNKLKETVYTYVYVGTKNSNVLDLKNIVSKIKLSNINKVPPEDISFEISCGSKNIYPYFDSSTNKYVYFEVVESPNIDIFNAADNARDAKFKGLKGRLATPVTNSLNKGIMEAVTSTKSQLNLKKEPLWIGGTSLRITSNNLVNTKQRMELSTYLINIFHIALADNPNDNWYWSEDTRYPLITRDGIDFNGISPLPTYTTAQGAGVMYAAQSDSWKNKLTNLTFVQESTVNGKTEFGKWHYSDPISTKNGYIVQYESANGDLISTGETMYSAYIPQPVLYNFAGNDGKKLKDDELFPNDEKAYKIGSTIEVPNIAPTYPAYEDPVAYIKGTNTKVTLPLKSTEKKILVEIRYNQKTVWGNVPWEFNNSTGVLTLDSKGIINPTLGDYKSSPWNRTDDKKISATKISKIVLPEEGVKAPVDSSFLFSSSNDTQKYLNNIKEIENINNLNVKETTKMTNMFGNAKILSKLDLSDWDTRQVKDMQRMFILTGNLKSIEFGPNFKTEEVLNMSEMFARMESLESLNLSNFNTSNVVNMTNMFIESNKLNEVSLGQKTKLSNDVHLVNPVESNEYSGKWQTVGTGTSQDPTGNWEGTTTELILRTQGSNSSNDTYVWQPYTGNISISKYPEEYKFETKIEKNQVMVAKPIDESTKYIGVKDTRKKTTPWELNVSVKPLTSEKASDIESALFELSTELVSFDNNDNPISFPSGSDIPNIKTELRLYTDGSSAKIMDLGGNSNQTPKVGEYGLGISDVLLRVPNRSVTEESTYESNLQWMLELVP